MSVKKKAMTKAESNKRYLANKKAKKEAAMFKEVLETQPVNETIKAADFQSHDDDGIHLPPPTNSNLDADEWEPYAPKANNVPLAQGETQETAIKPGYWHSIDDIKVVETDKAAMSLEESVAEAEDASKASSIQFSYNLPKDSVERLEQAVDAIRWLSRKTKDLPPKTKEILSLRILRIEELIKLIR
jgi:hypothetical protein